MVWQRIAWDGTPIALYFIAKKMSILLWVLYIPGSLLDTGDVLAKSVPQRTALRTLTGNHFDELFIIGLMIESESVPM